MRVVARLEQIHLFAPVCWLNGKYGSDESEICWLFSASFTLYTAHIIVDCQHECGLCFSKTAFVPFYLFFDKAEWGAVGLVSLKGQEVLARGFERIGFS